MHLRVRVHNTEVKNPLLKVLIAIPAVLIALGIMALVLLFVLLAVGIVVAHRGACPRGHDHFAANIACA